MKSQLTIRQELFCKAYCKEKNATQSALIAGYSKRTAYSMGQRLLKHVEIKRRIEKEFARQARRIEVSADKVIQEIAKLAFVNAEALLDEDGRPKNVKEMPRNITACISSMDFDSITGKVVKIRLWNKEGALEMLAKHFDILGKDKDKDGDNYLIHIIDSFNGDGNKKLSEDDKIRISEARSVIQETLSKRQSVPTN